MRISIDDYIELYIIACGKGHLDIIKYLIRLNFPISHTYLNSQGFIHACRNGQLDIAKHFILFTSNINDIDMKKAFIKACRYGQLHVAKWLYSINPEFFNNNIDYIIWKISDNSYYCLYLHIVQWFQSLRPHKYKIYYDEYNDSILKCHINTKEEELWNRRKYFVWLASNNSPKLNFVEFTRKEALASLGPNKKSIIYNLPLYLLREIILYI